MKTASPTHLHPEGQAAIIWHDLECGCYTADLSRWRKLASERSGGVLDIGAGTGRVTLDLARQGHSVVALDRDAVLLDELARRAALLGDDQRRVAIHEADARRFDLDQNFGLIAVPMQTVQLLGGPDGRAAFLACAVRHLKPGGRLAVALTEHFDLYDLAAARSGRLSLPAPDVREVSGTIYRSQATAVRLEGATVVLERQREELRPDGSRSVHPDRVILDLLAPEQLETEAQAAGLHAAGWVDIPPTPDHVGSVVVMLDA